MKLIVLFVMVIISRGNLVDLNSDCPEQFVSDPNMICIRPVYIEGCHTYLNHIECAEC